jgi:hypothetical protein
MKSFMQLGEGHCWICHQTYFQTHVCTLETTFPTPCNELTCGLWFEKRYENPDLLPTNK